MNSSDLIAIVALLISALSLVVSLKSANFGKRTKVAEMRSLVMSKASEVSNNLFELRVLFTESQKKAEELNDIAMYKEFNVTRISKLHESTESTKQRLEKLTKNRALEVYEFIYHELENVNQQILAMDKYARKQYEEHMARISKKPNT
ncbi:hypothetical protein [Shewanella xiamenensis]|uniref:hypothetical protein n=1 Tax=Shewanella xiamenensis TaxID=332186 RepID=UPI0035B841A6